MKRRLYGWLMTALCGSAVPLGAQIEPVTPPTTRAALVAANYQPLGAVRSGTVAMPSQLARRVSLTRNGVLLQQALLDIATQAGLGLSYGEDLARAGTVISIEVSGARAADALAAAVRGTPWAVFVNAVGQVTVIRAEEVEAGVIVGRVTDAKSGEGLVGAEVQLEGTRWRASTGADGRYRIAEVEPGSYTLAVRRIGYVRQAQAVTVSDGQEVTVDVALEPRPTQLDEVVTTVTGEQRLRELGHVVGRINADSLVKEAPVSSLSELLNGRVPGLQVFQSHGTVGGNVRLQVRGANSLNLNTQPIVIIDGVRYTSQATRSNGITFMEPTSPLNDLNPNDIESIEVVKGPSAATLYGTDASNGVLVITTKRGRPGPARWNAYGKATRNEIATTEFPELYWGWGTVNGVPDNTEVSCTLERLANSTCTQQDSVTVLPNPLNDPQLTLFGTKPRWEYGANVAGGQQDLRYYFSGDFEDATGPVQMPVAIAEQLQQQRGLDELPEEWREPNAFSKLNLRANVTAVLGAHADLRLSSGYVRSNTRSLAQGSWSPYSTGAFTGTPATPYGLGFDGTEPAQSFLQTSTDRTDRFFGSASAQWRPLAWLATRATVGLDLTGSNRYSLARRGDMPNHSRARNGYVGEDRGRQVATAAELGATVTARRGRLSSRTAVGAQYVRTLNDLLSTSGFDLPPGGSSMGEAATVQSFQTYAEAVTLGSYLEETLGWNDRLFLTGAVRVDGASAFGRNYDAAVYPKVSVSWLLSEEPFLPRVPGLDELRLRYAYGASGQQPTPNMARPGFRIDRAVENGAVINVVRLNTVGNPAIRSERVREHELGFDVAGLSDRLRLGFTWYRRRTVDQIALLALPPGTRFTWTNLGLTTQHGFEAELTAQLLNTRLLSWDVTLQHGLHRTTLVDLGGANENRSELGGWAEGYPLGARFMRPVQSYADVNGDGIITFREVQVDFVSPAVYAGESSPPRSQTLTTVVGLLERRLRLSALVERRSGFTQVNQLLANQCGVRACRARVDRSTPLAEQAQTYATSAPEPGDFTRLREVTAALDLPASLLRPLRLRTATLALSVRNLALWTDFSGPDPESVTSSATAISGGTAQGIPQGRAWALRVDLGL